VTLVINVQLVPWERLYERAFSCTTGTDYFVECQSLENTRQTLCRGLGEMYIVNGLFAKCIMLGTRQSLCRVTPGTRQRKVTMTATSDGDKAFVECLLVWHLAKEAQMGPTATSMPRVTSWHSVARRRRWRRGQGGGGGQAWAGVGPGYRGGATVLASVSEQWEREGMWLRWRLGLHKPALSSARDLALDKVIF
jgi:hypothetical protein